MLGLSGLCSFELSMFVLEQDKDGSRRLKLDVAVGHGEPTVIAEGLGAALNPRTGTDPLRFREPHRGPKNAEFPIALLLRGLETDIASSQASREEDRRRILNSICGLDTSELDHQEPAAAHHKYEQVKLPGVALLG